MRTHGIQGSLPLRKYQTNTAIYGEPASTVLRFKKVTRSNIIYSRELLMIRPAGSPTATLLRLLPGSSQRDQTAFRRKEAPKDTPKQQSTVFSNQLSPGQRRAVCTKDRDVISVSWWLTLTWSSLFTENNCNLWSQIRDNLTRLPYDFSHGHSALQFSL